MSMKHHQKEELQQQDQDQENQETMNHLKNPNLETTQKNNHHVVQSPSSSSQDFKKTHHQNNTHIIDKSHQHEDFNFKNANEVIKNPNLLSSSASPSAGGEAYTTPPPPPPPPPLQDYKKKPSEVTGVAVEEESGREKLRKHRVEMAGRVRIPDIWGHEDLLKDWIDCTVFDSSLGNKSIMSARAALIQERRSTVRIEN